jgi:predicted dehydrogenase
VEKPFTVNVAEAEELIALAKSKGRLLTAGHNLQFSPEAIRMREMVASGFLGGPPIHIDCMQLFTHAEPNYGTAVLGDVDHWVRSLPGSLLHNLISHGLAKIVEFLPGDNPRVLTHAFPSPYIRNVAQMEIVDELRTVIYGDNDVTAQFIFSTRLGAATNQLRLYGKDATLVVDSTNRTVIPIRPASYKSYLRYFLVPRIFAREYRRNSWDNMKQFLHARFHSDYGMWMLTRKFYEATKGACEIPISYREILNTAKIMDAIFSVLPRKA